jgi:hypothetical protein
MGGVRNHSTADHRLQSTSAPVDLLLARLDGVQQAGRGWRARCPSHGSDRNRSLSIAAADDGRVLLKCFAECPAADVLAAVGLTLADLFPVRITHATTPAERRELQERARMAKWRSALGVLAMEARVVLAAAGILSRGERLAPADDDRLVEAVERIDDARAVLR